MEKFDIGIIGAGPAGYVAAIYAAGAGKRVAVIEKGHIGGTCLNRGCIPTKALLASIEALTCIKEGPSLGIDVSSYKINFEAINRRKQDVVKKLRAGIETLFKARKIELISGTARLSGIDTIEAAGRDIKASAVLIATGSDPIEIPAFKFNHKTIISSDDALELEAVPKSMLIIGAGAVGCEFAAIYNNLGCAVTLVEMADEILPNTDREIAKRLNHSLVKKGINIFVSTKVERLTEQDGAVLAVLSSGKEVLFDKALVCVGRRPKIGNIGLEEAGILVKDGKIAADEYMRTNVKNIYTAGDVTSRYQLAHVASYEGILACDNMFGMQRSADYSAVPSCIYTDPEIASVGLSEKAARENGYDAKVARFPLLSLARAQIGARTEGLVKLVGDKNTDKLLGAHIFGHDATNLIAEAVLAIKKGLTVHELGETIHAHPTYSEAIMEASHVFGGRPIHTL